eukprot:gene6447-1150_t
MVTVMGLPMVAAGLSPGLPPPRPPMGWSSWYALGGSVNQTAMEQSYAKMANRSVCPGCGSKSLVDLGYSFANLDDGWQACGQGENGGYHDKNGYPLMDPAKFPNVTAMVALARSLGLKAGFYVNNYICGAGECKGGVGGLVYNKVMHATVQWLKANQFQYLKACPFPCPCAPVDSGGCYNDMTLWHELLGQAGHEMTVENCHQVSSAGTAAFAGTAPDGSWTQHLGGEPPNATWCPFDLWRVGGDVNGLGPDNGALLTAAAIAQGPARARAGCWPYPDFMALPSDPRQARGLFGLYAIMGTPMVFSFDIRDDAQLLPRWPVLTNEDVLAVNQDTTASMGTLIRRFSAHSPGDPLYAWEVPCNSSDPDQTGWDYDTTTRQLRHSGLCMQAGGAGSDLSLATCGPDPTRVSEQASQEWLLHGERLWQAAPATGIPASPVAQGAGGVGTLGLAPCAGPGSRPGQQWAFNPSGSVTDVRLNLTSRMGGCWEITGCSDNDGADVGTTYGCKAIPPSGGCHGHSDCDCNGAWRFHEGNQTIMSAMSGACLTTDSGRVVSSSCHSPPDHTQLWHWTPGQGTGQISLSSTPSMCVDDGDLPAPPGTDGNCASLARGVVGDGPGLVLSSPSSGSLCLPSKPPSPSESVSLVSGSLHIGSGNSCVAALHGRPSPFGPLQLWSKPLQDGTVAVALANRDSGKGPQLAPLVRVFLRDLLAGVSLGDKVVARDIWQHQDLPTGTVVDGVLTISALPGDTTLWVLRPSP